MYCLKDNFIFRRIFIGNSRVKVSLFIELSIKF